MSRCRESSHFALNTVPNCPCGVRSGATLTGTSPSFPLELLDRLATWQEEFDEHYDYETGWRSDVARDHWAEEARALTAELRAALGTRAKLVVELWPLGE
jgi:hypothetical protein